MFIRANSLILSKYAKEFLQIDSEEKLKLLKHFWMVEYKAQLEIVDQVPNKITFNRQQDMTLFLLKWS